ncbi:hypothetical protein C1D09_017325 [Mesorhizobium intechi]|uniref:Uncharacterized protein n=1 Tax=Mesorhizobium intechi TaxID=537601 RepID=A0A8T9AS10_9HYPH|nr:hypothetical protein [Mesorhizobium intechi]TSE08449.1 hypothetical protein C1D09_017325 [Mesorhizobium intechi]
MAVPVAIASLGNMRIRKEAGRPLVAAARFCTRERDGVAELPDTLRLLQAAYSGRLLVKRTRNIRVATEMSV